MLTSTHALAMVSRVTSRQIVLTMRTKRKHNSKEKEEARPRNLCSLG